MDKPIAFIVSVVTSILAAILAIVNYILVDIQYVRTLKSENCYSSFLDDAVMGALEMDGLKETVLFKICTVLFCVALLSFIIGFIIDADSIVAKITMPLFKLLQYSLFFVIEYNFFDINYKINTFMDEHNISETKFGLALIVSFLLLGLIAALICKTADSDYGILTPIISGSFFIVFMTQGFFALLIVAICFVLLFALSLLIDAITDLGVSKPIGYLLDASGHIIAFIYGY